MPKIRSAVELEERRSRILSGRDPAKPGIAVCAGSGCLAAANDGLVKAFEAEIQRKGLETAVDIRATDNCTASAKKGRRRSSTPRKSATWKYCPRMSRK